QRLVTEPVQPSALIVPLPVQPGNELAVLRLDLVSFDRNGQPLQRDSRIGYQRDPIELRGVEVGDVDVDEAHIWVSERGPGSRREVRPALADTDHHARSRGEP